MLRIGIVGLPNVGKSTLFNALTRSRVVAENFPFSTTTANSAIVKVPDPILTEIALRTKNPKLMAASIEFVDIPGLIRNAHRGEGLGNEFLNAIRTVDCILHLVRGFTDPNISHVEESIDPIRDVEIIASELARADIALADKHRIQQISRARNTGELEAIVCRDALEQLWRALREGKTGREAGLREEQIAALRQYNFLTLKPMLYVVNVGEGEQVEMTKWESQFAPNPVIPIVANIESELSQLDEHERAELRGTFMLQGDVPNVIVAAYRMLKLVTFYTFGEGITRAWPVAAGTTVLQAAGLIHTDFLQTFVKARILRLEELDRVVGIPPDRWMVGKVVTRTYTVTEGDILWIITA